MSTCHAFSDESYIYPSGGTLAKVSLRNDTAHTMSSRTLAFRFNHLLRPLGHRPSPSTFIPTLRSFSTSLAVLNANSGSGRDRDVGSGAERERPKASHPTKHEPRSASSGKPVAELTKEDEKKRSGVPGHPDESEFFRFRFRSSRRID